MMLCGLMMAWAVGVYGQTSRGAGREPTVPAEDFIVDFFAAYASRDWRTMKRMMMIEESFQSLKEELEEPDREELRALRQTVRGGYRGLSLAFRLLESGLPILDGKPLRHVVYEAEVESDDDGDSDHPLVGSHGPFMLGQVGTVGSSSRRQGNDQSSDSPSRRWSASPPGSYLSAPRISSHGLRGPIT